MPRWVPGELVYAETKKSEERSVVRGSRNSREDPWVADVQMGFRRAWPNGAELLMRGLSVFPSPTRWVLEPFSSVQSKHPQKLETGKDPGQPRTVIDGRAK